ncbi:MAG: Gfo/Idh/MocA family oxidoreductase [Planctomycetaceae bacterium]|nr:Gfo/Idh/MocA family oxidoreductase [Planctomycetaceae bacterium]
MPSDRPLERHLSRRQFLGSSALSTAGVAAGVVALGGAAKASASERIRLGVIGVRGQGKALAGSFARFADCEVATLCDVDESLFPSAVKLVADEQNSPPAVERDFRHLLDDPNIDAVVVSTPDHWHAVMTILACQAGKDVYVEKPASQTLQEGDRMIAAARRYGRVVQTGIQQRSGAHFQSAIEFVRSGRLGDVKLARAWTVHKRKPIGTKSDTPAPHGVDYDLWLGPASHRPFNPNRYHYNWHWFWEYGTGELGNWGVHMLDIARWGLGVELPQKVSSTGGKLHFHDDQETPDTQFVTYDFGGRTITWEHCLWSSHGPEGRSTGAAFYGENGTLVVDRGGWKVYDLSETIAAGPSDQATPHHRNFLDCIRTRALPTADIALGHTSSALCHLGNIAQRVGRPIAFDSVRRDFGADVEANALLSREYRRPWELPTV